MQIAFQGFTSFMVLGNAMFDKTPSLQVFCSLNFYGQQAKMESKNRLNNRWKRQPQVSPFKGFTLSRTVLEKTFAFQV